jgi:hypothetical protein
MQGRLRPFGIPLEEEMPTGASSVKSVKAAFFLRSPDVLGDRFFAVFEGTTLDNMGIPLGCPALSTTPDYKTVLVSRVRKFFPSNASSGMGLGCHEDELPPSN